MGHKYKNKEKEVAIEHYNTQLYIRKIKLCSNCPLKLYANENDKIILGTGTIITNIIMILPSYDVNANIGYITMLKIVQDVYKDIIGKELLEDVYVTRSIKCFNKTDFNLEKDAIKSCITNLIYEIGRITPTKIIIFDKHLYNFNLYQNKLKYVVKTVLSPGVMYYDNQNLKDIFIKQFKEAIFEI